MRQKKPHNLNKNKYAQNLNIYEWKIRSVIHDRNCSLFTEFHLTVFANANKMFNFVVSNCFTPE